MSSNNPQVLKIWNTFKSESISSLCSHTCTRHMQTGTICIRKCANTKMHLHVLTHIRTHTHANKTVTHLHKWKQWTVMKPDTQSGNSQPPSLSLSLSLCLQCVLFFSHSLLHLFYIMFSAISQSNSVLTSLCLSLSFCNNWGKWVLASRKKRHGKEQRCESPCWGGSWCALRHPT